MITLNHPPLDLRRRYAQGTLGPPFEFTVAAHLDVCAACRSTVEGFEVVSGALMADLEPMPLEAGALQATLERLDAKAAPPPVHDAPAWLPPSLRRQRLGPEFPIGGGVFLRRVWSGRGGRGRAYLLRARAGTALPLHDHRGVEVTCVLKGGYHEENGAHPAGDFFLARPGEAHTPHIDSDGECVCLIATDAPPKSRGLPGVVMRALM